MERPDQSKEIRGNKQLSGVVMCLGDKFEMQFFQLLTQFRLGQAESDMFDII